MYAERAGKRTEIATNGLAVTELRIRTGRGAGLRVAFAYSGNAGRLVSAEPWKFYIQPFVRDANVLTRKKRVSDCRPNYFLFLFTTPGQLIYGGESGGSGSPSAIILFLPD